MKNYLTLLFFLPLGLVAQDNIALSALLIPAEISENANAVIRNERVEVNVSAPDRATLKVTRAVTLFNDRSHYNVIEVHYDSYNKLGKIKGRIYDRMGKLVRELKKSEIRDQSTIQGSTMYSDSRVRYIEVDYAEYPFTVEFEYSKTYKDLQGYDGWRVREFGVGVEKGLLLVDLPARYGLYHETLNLEIEPEVKIDGGRQQYIWKIANLPPVKYEANSPPLASLLPAVNVSPGTFKVEEYTGSMATWADFGHFMNKLTAGRGQLSPVMKSKVQELTAGANSDQEKIDVLYRYMQDNMRYVSVQLGIGGWQPFDAGYVEANKYGDCKALSNFMKAMLTEAGIPSNLVLVYWGDLKYEVKEDFVNPRFNHMMLYVPSEDCWLECTSSDAPAGYLDSDQDNRNVMLVTDNGGKLVRTPAFKSNTSIEQNELNILLEKTGEATLQMSSIRTGEKQEYYRSALTYLSPDELKERLQENLPISNFDLQNLEVSPDDDEPKTKVSYEALVHRYASKAGKRLFVPVNPLNAFDDIPPSMEDRQHPIIRRRGYTESDRIVISMPEGYEVESIPSEKIIIESEHVSYSCQAVAEEGKVIVERRLEVHPCDLPAEEYEAWRDVYKQIAKADGVKMVLVEKKT